MKYYFSVSWFLFSLFLHFSCKPRGDWSRRRKSGDPLRLDGTLPLRWAPHHPLLQGRVRHAHLQVRVCLRFRRICRKWNLKKLMEMGLSLSCPERGIKDLRWNEFPRKSLQKDQQIFFLKTLNRLPNLTPLNLIPQTYFSLIIITQT